MSFKKTGTRILSVFTGLGVLSVVALVQWIYIDGFGGNWFSKFSILLYLIAVAGISLIVWGLQKNDKKEEEAPGEKKE